MYKIEINKAAEKQFKALPKADAHRILKKIAELATDPRSDGCKKPEGMDGLYRV